VVVFSPSNRRPENNSRRKPAGIFDTLSGSLRIARYNNRWRSYSPRMRMSLM